MNDYLLDLADGHFPEILTTTRPGEDPSVYTFCVVQFWLDQDVATQVEFFLN